MDALMFDEVLALCQGTLSQEEFNEKLVIRQHRFNCVLESQVKDMLPDKNLPKIGNGFSKCACIMLLISSYNNQNKTSSSSRNQVVIVISTVTKKFYSNYSYEYYQISVTVSVNKTVLLKRYR